MIEAENEILNRISDVSTMLRQERIAIHKRCKRTIEEFGIYSWDSKAADRGEDAPIKENDHCQDAVRYFVRTKHLVRRDTEYKSVLFGGR